MTPVIPLVKIFERFRSYDQLNYGSRDQLTVDFNHVEMLMTA